jgi:nucleoside-diphosphate-sugar epimerase
VFEPLPQDDPKQRRPDISKAQRLLGWNPTIDLRTGLMKMIDFVSAKVESDEILAAS